MYKTLQQMRYLELLTKVVLSTDTLVNDVFRIFT